MSERGVTNDDSGVLYLSNGLWRRRFGLPSRERPRVFFPSGRCLQRAVGSAIDVDALRSGLPIVESRSDE